VAKVTTAIRGNAVTLPALLKPCIIFQDPFNPLLSGPQSIAHRASVKVFTDGGIVQNPVIPA
jgi:hypothetical protein